MTGLVPTLSGSLASALALQTKILRGGSWRHTSLSGVFAYAVDSPRTFVGWTVGFRAFAINKKRGGFWSTPVQVISIGSFLALNRISVIKEDTGYKAWITVKTTGNLMQVQLATSTDGKTWSSTYTQCSGIKCIGETASTQLFNCVGKENDKYVGLVCDTSGNVYVQTSTDGILWRKCYDNYNSLFLPVGYDATNATKWNVSTTGVVKVGDEWCVVMLGYGKDSVWRLLGGSTKFLVPGNRIICKDLSGKEWCSTLFGGERSFVNGDTTPSTSINVVYDESSKTYFAIYTIYSTAVYLASSTDGVNWATPITVYGNDGEGVFSSHDGVVKTADKMQACFPAQVNETGTTEGGAHVIMYVDSSDGGKTWGNLTRSINHGSSGYDGQDAQSPTVLYDNSKYEMWYYGTSNKSTYYLVHAISVDGKTWSNQKACTIQGSDIMHTLYHTVVKISDTDYRMWRYIGTDILYHTSADGISWSASNTLNLPFGISSFSGIVYVDGIFKMFATDSTNPLVILYSKNGVTDWTPDINSPMLTRNYTVTLASNTADAYIDAQATSIETPYMEGDVIHITPSDNISSVPMLNAKRIHFDIRCPNSDSSVGKILFGDFVTNANIQNLYTHITSNTADSAYVASRDNSSFIAKVNSDGTHTTAGDTGYPNDDGLAVQSSSYLENGNITDVYINIAILEVYGDEDITRTLTGTCDNGHDGTSDGITDLTGNTWEMITGLRLVDGQIQITPNNDSAQLNYYDDYNLKAIDTAGNLVDTTNANTLYYDGAAGATKINTSTSTKIGDEGATTNFLSLSAATNITVPTTAKALGIYPSDAGNHGDAKLIYKTMGNGVAMFGGDANSNIVNGGPFTVNMIYDAGIISPNMGFRVCYYEPSKKTTTVEG